jgi:hypothetical protein
MYAHNYYLYISTLLNPRVNVPKLNNCLITLLDLMDYETLIKFVETK